jgi:hypothetical protein
MLPFRSIHPRAVGATPLLLVVAALALGGCATQPPIYQWGNYETLLYAAYKSPDRTEALRGGLEVHIAAMERTKAPIAPGLYAELGTLYLQTGDSAKAVSLYEKERTAWPESKQLMDSLIKTISGRANGSSSTGTKIVPKENS